MRGETKPELAFEQHPAPGRLGKRDSKSGDTHVDVIVEDSRTGVRLPPPPSFKSNAERCEGWSLCTSYASDGRPCKIPPQKPDTSQRRMSSSDKPPHRKRTGYFAGISIIYCRKRRGIDPKQLKDYTFKIKTPAVGSGGFMLTRKMGTQICGIATAFHVIGYDNSGWRQSDCNIKNLKRGDTEMTEWSVKVKSLSTYSLTTETITKGGNYEQSK